MLFYLSQPPFIIYICFLFAAIIASLIIGRKVGHRFVLAHVFTTTMLGMGRIWKEHWVLFVVVVFLLSEKSSILWPFYYLIFFLAAGTNATNRFSDGDVRQGFIDVYPSQY